jgi:hypothetical protein
MGMSKQSRAEDWVPSPLSGEERLKKALEEIERVCAELRLERAVADIDRIVADLRKAAGTRSAEPRPRCLASTA